MSIGSASRWVLVLAAAGLLGAGAPEVGAPAEDAEPVAEVPLSGGEIYDRVLDNRFNSFAQRLEMESGDRSGNTQATEVVVKFMSFRERSETILSKSIAHYQQPQDVRHLAYLVVNKSEGADDQFVYRPSARRVRRVNLRGESVFGTDFAYEDILPQEFEDADYERLPNEEIDGVDCYVVEVYPRKDLDSDYSKTLVYVTREHYVPLRTLYWDRNDVLVKRLDAEAASIASFEDEEAGRPKTVWITQRSKMTHLQLETFTELRVIELEANPGLRAGDFSERKLASSRR